mmetsp:Transcript_13611/g.22537  ORF Transcript_13611/g.22537 Transcript_13611/m.22537 type:complete len:406 (+) Transcript_13611:137-1354(+)
MMTATTAVDAVDAAAVAALKPVTVASVTDESSVATLLSDWNEESEEDDSTDSDTDDTTTDENENTSDDTTHENKNTSDAYRRLQHKFAMRDSLLKRMGKGKDASYVSILVHHESLVQAEAFQLLNLEQKKESKKTKATAQDLPNTVIVTKQEVSSTSTSPSSSLRNMLIFEARFTLPGLVALLLYCSAHMAAFEATQCLVMELTRIQVLKDSENMFHLGCIVAGLAVIRLTGGVFEWVSVKRHKMAKFDLHNRIRLNYTDAKMHLWFRQHKTVKLLLDTIALYICLVGVAFFHYRLLSPFFSNRDWIIDNLPSKAQGVAETPVHWWLKGRFTPECNAEDEQCSWLEEMTHQDERYVWDQVSVASYQQFMGNEAAPGLTPGALQVLHLSIATVAVFLLSKLGFNWH